MPHCRWWASAPIADISEISQTSLMRLLAWNLVLIPLMAFGLLVIAATSGSRAMVAGAAAIAIVYMIAISSVTDGPRLHLALRILVGLLATGLLTWLLGFWLVSQI